MEINLERFSAPCSCGHTHEISVKNIWIEPQATRFLPKLLEPYENPIFICDSRTRAASMEALKDLFEVYPVIEITSENVVADNEYVDVVMNSLPSAPDVLIAVGSGTIHDLTRFVSHKKSIPFISYPTAASVDGFVSTVAAMTWFGLKKTFPAQAPLYVVADTNIFSKAPRRLTAAGIGDLMGKYTSLADWKIASLVSGEYLCENVYNLMEEAVKEAEAALGEIRDGSMDGMEKLMYALLLSGLAMQMVGNSRPASGAEHHLSHLWEIHVINPPVSALHGEKVSVGLLLCLERYEKALRAIKDGRYTISASLDFERDLLKKYFQPAGLYDMIMEENQENLLTPQIAAACESKIGEIAAVLSALPGYGRMKATLEQAGCPTSLTDLGLQEDLKEISLQLSPYIRRRLTFMRLLKVIKLV